MVRVLDISCWIIKISTNHFHHIITDKYQSYSPHSKIQCHSIVKTAYTLDESFVSRIEMSSDTTRFNELKPMFKNDWGNIIRTIRENHEHATESAPIERPLSNDKKVQRFLQTLKFKSNPIEVFWHFFCDELQIPFEQLSVDEHKTMKDVFKRSKLLKALPNRKKGK